MRENLQSCGHLEGSKGRPSRQHSNRTCTPIAGRLKGPDNAAIVATEGIAERPNFPADDVLKDRLARTNLLNQLRWREPAERLVRKPMGSDFKTLRRQAPQLAVVQWPLPVVDRNVEGAANSPRSQEFSNFQIGVVAVIPTRGHNRCIFHTQGRLNLLASSS